MKILHGITTFYFHVKIKLFTLQSIMSILHVSAFSRSNNVRFHEAILFSFGDNNFFCEIMVLCPMLKKVLQIKICNTPSRYFIRTVVVDFLQQQPQVEHFEQ